EKSKTAKFKTPEEDDSLIKKEVKAEEFISAAIFEEQMGPKHVVGFGYRDSLPAPGSLLTIQFSTKEQPAFNRQFDLLIRDLKSWEGKGFTLYIFAENPKQLERLRAVFEDLKAEIVFNPVNASIHEGFIEEDLKIVCYTDHQVFQRYHKYKVKQA